MGRTKYSPEKRQSIIASFISAAQKIIDAEGIDGVSIRKVADAAGYSSATLYLYFKDVNELVLLSSIAYLEDYARDIVNDKERMSTSEGAYFGTWERFCRHAFAKPQVFYHLFFGKHSSSIDEMVKLYYSIYPHQLDEISGSLLSMFRVGDLQKRNLSVLEPFADELGLSRETAALINDITLCYFKDLLETAYDEDQDKIDIEGKTAQHMKVAHFLIDQAKA